MNPFESVDKSVLQLPGDCLPRPHENCYWLWPGRIVAGEYPRDFDSENSTIKIRAILADGVTRFIDLTESTEPLSPYDALLRSELTAEGLVAVHERHPIRDQGVPSIEGMRTIIDTLLAPGQAVSYLHCWGGIGRTGTVAGCLLVEAGFSANTAIDVLAQKWTVMEKRFRRPQSPETVEQFAYIKAWRPRIA